jgi:hypothetical protein
MQYNSSHSPTRDLPRESYRYRVCTHSDTGKKTPGGAGTRMRLEDSEHVVNSLQLKFNLIRMCASKIFGHLAGSNMPPDQTDAAATYSDRVNHTAVAELVRAADSPAPRAALALACAAQPAANGGLGVTTR